MPINFFDAESSTAISWSDLPFVKDYVLQQGEEFESTCSIISSAKHAQTGKGVLLFTEQYKFMLFTNSKAIVWLNDLLTSWVQKPTTGHILVCQTIDKYPYYRIGVDDSIRALWLIEGNGWSCIPDTTTESPDTLPLIPVTQGMNGKTTTSKANKHSTSSPQKGQQG